MNKSYYSDKYIPEIVKQGKLLGWIGALLVFAPVLAVTFIFDIIPEKQALIVALTAQLSINFVWWFIEPISYFPILGIPGTYISFLSGNISNLRMPCAIAAQKATGVTPGSDESTIIGTIGICASVFVNTLILILGVILGTSLLAKLPPEVKSVLDFLLPALFGAVFAQFAIDDIKIGIIAMVIAIGSLIMYNMGLFNWVPFDPSIAPIVIPIFGTIFISKVMFSKGLLPQQSDETV